METSSGLNFEVLIAALNGSQDVYSKANLHCHCIIANQGDETAFIKTDNFKFITTQTRGVGKNRNISLIYSSAKYILFGDDDVIYVDDLESIVVNAFKKKPQADVLIFNINTVGSKAFKRRQNKKIKRVRWYNFMNYGTVRIACRRESISKANIWFTELFGGGARYSCGEDTTFLADCVKKKLKIYTMPITIATVDQTTSTWFSGYNEKYFNDKGALLKSIFPKTYRIFCLYFAMKLKTKDNGTLKTFSMLLNGAKSYNKFGMN